MTQTQQTFSWENNRLEDLKPFSLDDLERGPTVTLFADTVRIFVQQARLGVSEYIRDLPLMISSLQNGVAPSQEGVFTFGDWIPAIGVVLTHRTCQMLGAQVCHDQGFNIAEAQRLIREYPLQPISQDADGYIGSEEY